MKIDPESWTEQVCPAAPDGGRHHWVPKREGTWNGEPSYVQTCRYCKATVRNSGNGDGKLVVVPEGAHR